MLIPYSVVLFLSLIIFVVFPIFFVCLYSYVGLCTEFSSGFFYSDKILLAFAFVKVDTVFFLVHLNMCLVSIFHLLFDGGGIFPYRCFCGDFFGVYHCSSCYCLVFCYAWFGCLLRRFEYIFYYLFDSLFLVDSAQNCLIVVFFYVVSHVEISTDNFRELKIISDLYTR